MKNILEAATTTDVLSIQNITVLPVFKDFLPGLSSFVPTLLEESNSANSW